MSEAENHPLLGPDKLFLHGPTAGRQLQYYTNHYCTVTRVAVMPRPSAVERCSEEPRAVGIMTALVTAGTPSAMMIWSKISYTSGGTTLQAAAVVEGAVREAGGVWGAGVPLVGSQ